jgi:hypothetical protein
MKISRVSTCIKVGRIVVGEDEYTGNRYVYHRHALELEYDSECPRDLRNRHLSIVYLFTVNGDIFKIGQSSGRSGIAGCMNFYLKSGQDDPGINRFAINNLIRDEISKGNVVNVYMTYMDLIKIEVPGLLRPGLVEVPISAKGMEALFMEQYFSEEGCFPPWNYQENGTPLPAKVSEAFGEYRTRRARGRM